jgi:hypothetical protein
MWYAVRLVYESLHPEETETPRFFEEQVILVRSDTEDAAREKAIAHAKGEEHEYKNAYGHTVTVEFLDVLDVHELLDDNIEEFSEVYSHFLNESELAEVRRSLEAGSADDRWPESLPRTKTRSRPPRAAKRAPVKRP